MRRPLSVAVAMLFAYLVVSAQPVAAATNTATLIHTNATDLGNAETLTNVSVTGSGASASVTLDAQPNEFEDGFEDEAADSGLPDDWSGGSGTYNVTTARAHSGSQSFFMDTGFGQNVRPSEQPYSSERDENVTFSMYVVDSSGPEPRGFRAMDSGGNRIGIIAMYGGDLAWYNGSWSVLSATPNDEEWVTVRLYNWDGTNDEVDIRWETNTNSGTIQNVQAEAFTTGYVRFESYIASGGIFVDDYKIGNDTVKPSGQYIGANHSAEAVTQGFTDLSLTGVSATVEWQGWDGSTWTVVDTATYTTTGNKSVALSGSYTKWRATVSFDRTSGLASSSAELQDEGVQFTNHDPTPDNSSASPSGGTTITSSPVTLSIDVNDTEFGTSANEQVTATFYVNGSQVGTDTLNANGTATYGHTPTIGGPRQWHVELSDSFGGSNTSDTFIFTSPSRVQIREETEPHELVKNANVEVRIFGSNNTLDKRTVSDGNISLSGLPIDETYVFVINASGYHQQSIIIDDLFAQSTVFVLNDSLASIENRFTIQDLTGEYTPIEDVSFKIQKSVNRSLYDASAATTYQWTTIAGDRLGADAAYTVDLKEGDRYRLVIVDPNGNERVLGPYTAETTGTISVTIAEDDTIEIRAVSASIGFSPDVGTLPARDTVNISASIRPGDITFTTYELKAIYNDGTSNTTLATTSGAQASGEVIDESLNLTGKAGGTLYAVVNYTTSSGFSGTVSAAYRIHESYGSQYSVLSVIPSITARLPGDSASVFTAMVSFLLVALGTTAVTTQLNLGTEIAGLVAVGGFVMFALIGWLAWQYVFAVGATWVFVTALRRGL